jgi:phage-related protein
MSATITEASMTTRKQLSSKWNVYFLDKTVLEEFYRLPKDLQASMIHIAEMIEEFGLLAVGKLFVKHVEDKIWEMRAKSKSGIARGLYVAAKNKSVYVLRVIQKKSGKLRRQDVEIAKERARRIL